jgi:cell division protein FtsZ
LGEDIRVTVVATGLSRQGARRTAPPLQVLRTGTDNVPFQVPTVNNMVGGVGNNVNHVSNSVADMDFSTLNRPAVWGTGRKVNAAARIDALSSGGMDDIEIPAFLRKQAD